MHDFNGGILASGLFWTLPVGDDDLRFSRDGRTAVLDVEDVTVIDSFAFGGAAATPATVSLHVEWRATGPFADRGQGGSVPATDAGAFSARFAVAQSTASFSGSELGFAFRSDGEADTSRTYAQMGRERNGTFLRT